MLQASSKTEATVP